MPNSFVMRPLVSDSLTVFSAICWPVCFWWMHRISRKQNAMLDNLKRETEVVRKLSKEEHAVVQEIHPKVKEIAEKLG